MQYNPPELKPSDIDLNLPLHDYQRYIRQFIEDTPFCGLFLDMGLGKTLITLAALYDLNPRTKLTNGTYPCAPNLSYAMKMAGNSRKRNAWNFTKRCR